VDTPTFRFVGERRRKFPHRSGFPDETEVTVRKGEAEVSTSSGSTNVRKGEMIVVRGTGTDAQYKVEDARNRDDWDKWNDDRDHIINNAESVHRTSPYYTGAQDLDAYGHWTEMPDYGSVWFLRYRGLGSIS